MTVLSWILGCAVVCTGISCLILLNQRNSPKLKHVHMDVSENGCILPHRKECLLYDQEYAIRWPDLAIAFEKDESSGIPFLVWRGAVRSQRKLLFVFYQEQTFSAFMHACACLFSTNQCPANAFEALRVPENCQLNEEILYRMKTSGDPYYGVIVDDSGFLNLSQPYPLCALVGIGSLSKTTLQITGDTDEYDWLVEQKPKTIAPLQKTEERVMQLQVICSALHVKTSGISWKARAESLIRQIPGFTQLFYPHIIHDGDTVTVFDQTDDLVEKDIRALCEKGQKAGIVLQETDRQSGFTDWPMNHELYDRIVNALHASDHLVPIIPYRMALTHPKDIHVGCSVMHFAPTVHGIIDSSFSSICFYEKLLNGQKQ